MKNAERGMKERPDSEAGYILHSAFFIEFFNQNPRISRARAEQFEDAAGEK